MPQETLKFNVSCKGSAEARSDAEPFVPKTELGRKLMQARAEIIASGAPLLDWEAINWLLGRS